MTIELYAKDGTKITIDPENITEIKSIANGSEVRYDGTVVKVYEVPSRIQSIIARRKQCPA